MIGCIQYRNTRDGKVHIFELEKDGSRFHKTVATAIETSDAPNFTFDFVPRYAGADHEFCAIKTRNTKHGKVEIHVLSRSSDYNTFILQRETPFTVEDAPNFDFVMGKGNGHLIGIKRRNTRGPKVEVHMLSHISEYQTFIYQGEIPITLADVVNFDFGASVGDSSVGIKRANTETGSVEVHIPKNATEWTFQGRTAIGLELVPGRTWLCDNIQRALVGVTNGPTASGFVEILRNVPTHSTGFPAPPSKYRSRVLDTSRIGDFIFKMIGVGHQAGGGGGL